ncbi:crossover junction endodeoxyribonuclease RuvC [Puniceicoccaceae bacterium K14]|nr:crossover junction endodeoxyribonuclease RuvC [Puniceicoccaceae bacterium K14]
MPRKGARELWKDKIEGKSTANSGTMAYGPSTFRGVILGIDPSLRGTGLAVVEFVKPNQPIMLHCETLKLNNKLSMCQCLAEISTAVTRMLDTYPVDAVASEQTIYVQNFQTAQILGAARGAALAAVAVKGFEVFEYPPLRVKQAVVGAGRASKEQVARTVKSLLGHGALLGFDESDAAAVAFTHAFTHKS